MAKLLKAVHILFLLVMLLYCGLVIEQFVVKILDPGNESLRFWKPSGEMGVIVVAFVTLLGILACSTRLIRSASWGLLTTLHGLWLGCFTWAGWFSAGAPFRIHELVRVDFSDAAAVNRAETIHLLQALALYIVMVLISSIPLLMRWFEDHGRNDRSNRPGKAPNPVLQHH